MSISGVGSYMNSSMSPDMMAQMRGTREGGSKEDFVSSVFEKKDSDGNGLLSLEETGMNEDMFTSVDTDGDSNVSEEEVLADMQKRHEEKARMGELSTMMQGGGKDQGGQENLLDSFMDELDLDGDSQISMEESGLTEDLFNVLDSDSDGNISGEELKSAMSPPEGMEAMVSAASGGSGGAESSSSSEDDVEYDEYDLNQDGVVSTEELRQAFKNGDQSLASVFGQNEGQGLGGRGAGGERGGIDAQSSLTRMAMRAYQEQNSETYTGSQGVVI
ncbi:Ca2+-binding protein, EF-hand superfamily [Maridesulfovibrio ferrireducens]|uniref:Ca2+-binding protein, EF-hand superfamily n=1 Tax=Maridesulfovibrio ferrireducens TaxID=246191 RepID=A0A1G9IYS7_9BACT|nr:EF-hand domain-containing protein [Maridesulfovibrio ferrireducens]SDL29994.1 Ca2+-binding protein, EF-hand superfamily [Maridesulfovibrio ferrireducens]